MWALTWVVVTFILVLEITQFPRVVTAEEKGRGASKKLARTPEAIISPEEIGRAAKKKLARSMGAENPEKVGRSAKRKIGRNLETGEEFSRAAISLDQLVSDYVKSIPSIQEAASYTGFNVTGSQNEANSPNAGRSASEHTKTKKISDGSPMYFAGYDKEHRPFWVFDFGRSGVVSYVARRSTKKLLSWQSKILDEIQKSVDDSIAEGNNITGFAILFDFSGSFLSYLSSIDVMTATKLLLENFIEDDVSKLMNYAFVINLTPTAEIMLEASGLKSAKEFRKALFYGTDQNVWGPALLEKIDQDQLPPEYGGNSNFTPVALYPIVSGKKH